MNKIQHRRARFSEIIKVNSMKKFHKFFFDLSIKEYKKLLNLSKDFGSVLVLGASNLDAEEIIKYPFKKIVLSGITNPDNLIKEVMKKDSRVSYTRENIEKISFDKDSFDLVFVKESLHHVPRPVLGLYEMLRVSKKKELFLLSLVIVYSEKYLILLDSQANMRKIK